VKLPTTGVEYWSLAIASEPEVSPDGWELSVDGGGTWKAATLDPDDNTRSRWLLAGPDADLPPAGSVVVENTVTPILRHIDQPERLYRKAPKITLVALVTL
jgi:hypothetical protein